MSGFKVEKQTAGAVAIDDLGITLTGAIGTIVDLTDLAPENVARSADLLAAIPASILVVDPRDDSDTTILSSADSTEAVTRSNDVHFGVSGGRFAALDDPTVTLTDNFIVQYDSGSDSYQSVDPATFIGDQTETIEDIVGAMGTNGTDTTFSYNDGAGTVQWDVDDVFLRNTGDTLDSGTLSIASGATLSVASGASFTISASASAATIDTPVGGFANANDLVNKFYVDSLAGGFDYKESVRVGTTTTTFIGGTIAAQDETAYDGAGSNGSFVGGDGVGGTAYVALDTITLSDGTLITVDAVDGNGDVTQFTVTTSGTGNTDGQVLTQASTSGTGLGFVLTLGTNNISGVYATSPSNGQFTGVDLSSGTGIDIDGLNFTGTASTGLVIGDRILIKDQTDATQNGIYFIDAGSTSTNVTLTRAADQDGSPASEVSGGNTVYVDDTTVINGSSVNSNTRWSVVWDGIVTLNTDPVDWTQTAGAGSTEAGIGLSRTGTTLDLDVNDLTTATVVATDTIAFHDASGTPEPSGSITRKTTFQSVFNELDVPNGINTNGIIVRTANDTYASRSIAVDGAGPLDGLAVSNGDGVSGDPTIGLDIQNLPLRAAVDATNDRVAVWDSSANANVYYSVNDIAGAASASNSFETWLGAGNTTGDASIVADSATDTANVTGGIGINIDLTAASDTITWSFTRAGMADTAVVGGDTIAFFDASNANEPEFRSFTDLISDLSLIANAYTTIGGDSGSATASGSDTLNLVGETNGGITTTASEPGTDQVAFGITPVDLTTGAATLATGDFIIVSDSLDGATTLALKYTFQDVIDDLGLTVGGVTNAFGLITGGDGGTATAIGTDTITVNGTGINITATNAGAGADTLDLVLDIADLTAGAGTIVVGDEIAVNDGGTTVRYTFTDVVQDLDIPNAITANGIVVRTAEDTYTSRTITASADEDELGIAITNGDGVAGNPTVGLDIVGLTDPAAEMAATDELPVHDKSEGTGGANRKVTGQNIADGTATILGIDTLTFDTFTAVTSPADDQTLLAYTDSTRSKVLSVESHTFQWADNKLSDNDWIKIGSAGDALSGWVMPFDGTIVGVTAHTESLQTATDVFDIDLYIDNVDSGAIAVLTGAGEQFDTDPTLDVDFAAGEKLSLRIDQTTGTDDLGDTTVALLVKWRS